MPLEDVAQYRNGIFNNSCCCCCFGFFFFYLGECFAYYFVLSDKLNFLKNDTNNNNNNNNNNSNGEHLFTKVEVGRSEYLLICKMTK